MSRTQSGAAGSEARSRGGRALDSTRDSVLRQAALELLAEVGYDRLTMDAVAARAHAGKPTIYRRWHGKAELVVDALNSLKGAPTVPDTGSLRGDLDALAASLSDAEGQFGVRLMVGMLNALTRDAELRQLFLEKFLAPRLDAFRIVFSRAVARGEMSGGHDLDLLARLLPAFALQELILTGEMPTPGFAHYVTNQLLHPLATAPATNGTSGLVPIAVPTGTDDRRYAPAQEEIL